MYLITAIEFIVIVALIVAVIVAFELWDEK